MQTKLILVAVLVILLSCNANNENDTKTVNTETTTTTDDESAVDTEAEKKALNEQSLACIALMNKLEPELNAAYANADTETARAIKARIDSTAIENVKIGQKLMALDK